MSGAHDEHEHAAGGGDTDADLVRTFEALPPARGRAFATTWWGRAWLGALEDTALDGEQLRRGRRQAREGAVGAVSVRPGRITAVVRDRDGTAYRSDVLLQRLGDEEWDRFLSAAVERGEHIAALLDREMPPHLVEDAAAAGVDLLPGIGDLEPECTCEAWDHCPHTAALCYQLARLLDRDPFVLLLMRGRGERRLLDELQVRSASRAAAPDEPEVPAVEGVRADEAFAAAEILPALPPVPPLPEAPGPPPSLDAETDPGPGVDAAALEFLAADAAGRALALLGRALAPGHGDRAPERAPDRAEDSVRLAASAYALASVSASRGASGRGPGPGTESGTGSDTDPAPGPGTDPSPAPGPAPGPGSDAGPARGSGPDAGPAGGSGPDAGPAGGSGPDAGPAGGSGPDAGPAGG
ncbi:hypothetical protein, partial [Streptomyces sp. NPDC005805]|uniref:SWIM zinc finger family protein n=1 Tax=Streptomyces sp. NPDC005805 TaxID=3157068 RepID=UPI0033F3EB0C